MASVNYLGRIQLDEIHTQAMNKTTPQLLYLHYVGKHLDSYCDFVSTFYSRYWCVQIQVRLPYLFYF